MVVRPPSLLPGDGLLLISAPKRPAYYSHHLIRSRSFWPTSGRTARRVSRCSARYISVVSPRTAVPPCATTRSAATPSAGLAVTPELPSDPPHSIARWIFEAGCPVRAHALASGKSWLTAATAASTVREIPPCSWMLSIRG